MITLIKLNQRTTLVHHLFVLQPTAAAMFWRHTGVSTTSCIGLSACPICWGHPNGLHSIAYAFDQTACDKLETCGRKEREKKKKHNWGVRGPSVVPAWKLQSLPWNSQCLPWNLYCLPWSPKRQKYIRNHSRSKNVGSSW